MSRAFNRFFPCNVWTAWELAAEEEEEDVKRCDSSRSRWSARSFLRLSASVAPGSSAEPAGNSAILEREGVWCDLGILED